MIGLILGKIRFKATGFLILETGGVGYKVAATPPVLLQAKVGEDLRLFIHTYVREDQISLYGFKTMAELEFFDRLLSVSGIGPKSALGIMSLSGLEMIKSAIASGDVAVFTKVAGIGRKTAERVIVELREKLKEEGAKVPMAQEHSEALSALVSLGFAEAEARQALMAIPPSVASVQEKIKLALKRLGK